MNSFRIEKTKLFKRKSTKVLIYIYAIIMIILLGIYFFTQKVLGVSLFTSGQFMIASLTLTMSFILPFISLYISSTSFSLDFGNGTIKNIFLLPIRRVDIYLGKVLAVLFLIGILLIIQFTLSLIFTLFIDGGVTIGSAFSYILNYIGAFIILGLVSLFGANLSLVLKSTGITILISYLLYSGMTIIGIYLPRLNNVLPSKIIRNYDQLLTSIDINLLLPVISYYIILFILGIFIFEKKEESVCQYE